MQRLEYHTAELIGVGLTCSKGWRLREINEQVQPDWKKSKVYASVTDFCNEIAEQGWELVSASYPGETVTYFVYCTLNASLDNAEGVSFYFLA